MTKTHSDKTSAEDKSIGFDYQYYFFLWKLLQLRSSTELVGIEVYDDVHIQGQDGKQVFYQIKHTVQTKADGSTVNLTSSDYDLWKTLYNWVKMIKDEEAGRQESSSQIAFIKNTDFLLASNKSDDNNDVLSFIKVFQENENIDILIENLNDFSTEDKKLQTYINEILSLDKNVLSLFFKKLDFKLNTDDLIEKCKQAIKAKMIPSNQVDRVFADIDSKIRAENYHKIKNREKITISFDEFHKKYQRYFNLSRDGSLPNIQDSFKLPNSLASQKFIKQLIQINEISESDLEEILEFTTFKMRIESQLLYWETEGFLVQEEIDRFKDNSITEWKNKFRKLFRALKADVNANQDFSISQNLLDELREIELAINAQNLGIQRSNGQYYSLLDEQKIKLVSN